MNTHSQDPILAMKISGPNSTSAATSAKRKGAARTSGDGFKPDAGAAATSARAAGGASAASSVQSVDAILALQGVEDFTHARKRATERAFSLLDVLDELKIGLLEGGLPRAKLVALMNLLQTRRDQTDDAQLEAALDEVETRAAVELAKFG
ncbi:flagellar assembly protein FliX [Maricaulis sp. CAU 1757]